MGWEIFRAANRLSLAPANYFCRCRILLYGSTPAARDWKSPTEKLCERYLSRSVARNAATRLLSLLIPIASSPFCAPEAAENYRAYFLIPVRMGGEFQKQRIYRTTIRISLRFSFMIAGLCLTIKLM